MSKMTKPTVGVVRFQESDVIVASGEGEVLLNLYNDKTVGNGSIGYNNNIYYTKNGETDFTPLSQALGGRDLFVLPNGTRMHVESVFYFENVADRYDEVEGSDGVYAWDASDSVWRWRWL